MVLLIDRCCLQGCNHRWKVEGDQGLGPNTGALAPRARPNKAGLGDGCGMGRPLLLGGSGGITPGNFFGKLRWVCGSHCGDYRLWNFLLFKNYGQEIGGGGSKSKSWEDQSPPVPMPVAPMAVLSMQKDLTPVPCWRIYRAELNTDSWDLVLRLLWLS